MIKRQTKEESKVVRCAIYTRKSTEERLDLEYNSLDAQRDAGEAYITSQKAQGWQVLPERYDDGGFTGGNLDRPGLQRLKADIQAGKIDCVVVYKVDRLSRSLMDFARLMQVFDEHEVSFVSVTQHFNTTHSMGRLTLNILLSFAQFEREIISERTRDKIAAARRRGKYSGGKPPYGYDIERGPGGARLVVNEKEAERVRSIFGLYMELNSLQRVVYELEHRGWRKKKRRTRKGDETGGNPFDRTTLSAMLANRTYTGKTVYRDEVFEGEHEAIIDEKTFERVQERLRKNRDKRGRRAVRHHAMLKGLVTCTSCGQPMYHHYTTKAGKMRYRYYVCATAMKRGWDACESGSVSAPVLEDFVVDQMRDIGRDPKMLTEVLHNAQEQISAKIDEHREAQKVIDGRINELHREIRDVAVGESDDQHAAPKLNALHSRLATAEQEATNLANHIAQLERQLVREDEIVSAIRVFDPMWQCLTDAERAGVVHMLIERVEFDGDNEAVTVTFRTTGIETIGST